MTRGGDTDCGPGTRCRCSPCHCARCGDVIGLYEPLVAVLDDDVTSASLTSIDRSGRLADALAFHEACYRAQQQAPATRAGA